MVKQWYPTKKLGKCLEVVTFGLWGLNFIAFSVFHPAISLQALAFQISTVLQIVETPWTPRRVHLLNGLAPQENQNNANEPVKLPLLHKIITCPKTSPISQSLPTSPISTYQAWSLSQDKEENILCKVSFSIRRKILFIGFKIIVLNT